MQLPAANSACLVWVSHQSVAEQSRPQWSLSPPFSSTASFFRRLHIARGGLFEATARECDFGPLAAPAGRRSLLLLAQRACWLDGGPPVDCSSPRLRTCALKVRCGSVPSTRQGSPAPVPLGSSSSSSRMPSRRSHRRFNSSHSTVHSAYGGLRWTPATSDLARHCRSMRTRILNRRIISLARPTRPAQRRTQTLIGSRSCAHPLQRPHSTSDDGDGDAAAGGREAKQRSRRATRRAMRRQRCR